MIRALFLIAALSVGALTAQADEAGPAKLQAGLEEFRARLALTPEQEAKVRAIFEAHIQALRETLDKHDIDLGDLSDRSAADTVDLQRMRALREELHANSAKIEGRLSEVLSAAQMTEFRRVRAEQEGKLRERLLSRRLGTIVAKLGLAGEQADQVRPILKDHFEAQMAVLDKHGIAPGNRDSANRPGFRTLRRLRKDMGEINEKTEERLSAILSEAQLAAYEALQAEQRKKLRALLFQR